MAARAGHLPVSEHGLMLSNPLARSLRTVGAGTVGRMGPIQHLLTTRVTGLKRSPLRHDLPAVAPRHAEPQSTS